MTGAKQQATDGGTLQMQATYAYDALSNRVEKGVWTSATGVQATRFGYDGQNVWVDVNSSNTLQMRRMFLDGIDQVFARVDSGGNAAWSLVDNLNSVREVINSANSTTDVLVYDAFGTIVSESNVSFGDRYKYTGREFDNESSLQYNRARFFSNTSGRWTTEDPLRLFGDSTNLYRYVGNSPLVATDPSGLIASIQLSASWAHSGFSVPDRTYTWTVQWNLRFPPGTIMSKERTGFVIQEITNIEKNKFGGSWSQRYDHYLEAWEVSQGVFGAFDGNVDEWSGSWTSDTEYYKQMSGSAIYFSCLTVSQLVSKLGFVRSKESDMPGGLYWYDLTNPNNSEERFYKAIDDLNFSNRYSKDTNPQFQIIRWPGVVRTMEVAWNHPGTRFALSGQGSSLPIFPFMF
jgi:RHS repeat-associated protein